MDYFYNGQQDLFTFYRIPKILFADVKLRSISADAKVLYGLMLDRMGLSVKNQWLDEHNRVYIIYTVDDIMEALDCAAQKATKLLSELEQDAGLIERRRRGLGLPNVIYVKSPLLNCDFQNSGDVKFINPDFPKSQSNKTDSNNTIPIKPPEGAPKRKHRDTYKAQPDHEPERFSKFWAEYLLLPATAGSRQKAIAAWDKLAAPTDLIDRMALAFDKQKQSADWQRGIGIPHASTWLNRHGWEDPPGPPPAAEQPKPAARRVVENEGINQW